MKPRTLQILVFIALAIATKCRALSFELDIIGDGLLKRDPSWEPWATFWYITSGILQVITIFAGQPCPHCSKLLDQDQKP